jgi:hypothetical protein
MPPRDLSETSRTQVVRDVPVRDYIDGLAMGRYPEPTSAVANTPASLKWTCRKANCPKIFSTRNKLFEHLRDQAHYVEDSSPSYFAGESLPIVKPSRKPHTGTGYAFRGFKFAEVCIRRTAEAEDQWICADSGCGMTMVDEQWLRTYFPQAHIASMRDPVKVQGIASDCHTSNL